MGEQVRDEFDVHMLNDVGIIKARALAAKFSQVLSDIEQICGADGREIAIVRTKLQEASFFAKRAMAVRVENQNNGTI